MGFLCDLLLTDLSVNISESAVREYNGSAIQINNLQAQMGETDRVSTLTVSRVYGHFINRAAREANQYTINANTLVTIQEPLSASLEAREVLRQAREWADEASRHANRAHNIARNISVDPMLSRTQALEAIGAAYDASISFNYSQLAVNRYQRLIRPYDPVRDV